MIYLPLIMENPKAERTVNYYDSLSQKYDSSYSAYLKHTHKEFLERLKIPKDASVLDVSAGTGILGAKILENFSPAMLVLNDPSEGMLQIARQRLENIKNVTFTDHLAEEFRFDDSSFDTLICLNSFHYYTDHQAVLSQFSRILKPGGTLYLQDWNLEGWFRLPNFIISTFSPENINTEAAKNISPMLKKHGLQEQRLDRWAFRFWKFFYVEATLNEPT